MKRLIPNKYYNNWTVLREENSVGYNRYFMCECACGTIKKVRLGHLTSGKTTSCGCVRDLLASERATTHGMAGNKTYKSWQHMKERCLNKKCNDWVDYGGRGIAVCERWMKFENFLADMGEKQTPKHQIDRINNNGNYEPSNCKWSTATEQANNKRNNTLITANGVTRTLSQWSIRSGIKREVISYRILRLGWTPEKALSQKVLNKSTFSTR